MGRVGYAVEAQIRECCGEQAGEQAKGSFRVGVGEWEVGWFEWVEVKGPFAVGAPDESAGGGVSVPNGEECSVAQRADYRGRMDELVYE